MALQAKLAELSQHVEKLDEVLQVTAEQAGCIRELGAYHGALYVDWKTRRGSFVHGKEIGSWHLKES